MRKLLGLWLMAMLAAGGTPAFAQAIQSIDPNTASAQQDATPLPGERGTAVNPPYGSQTDDPQLPPLPSDAPPSAGGPPPPNDPSAPLPPPQDSTLVTRAKPTYHKDDLIGAAEGVFGKGAAGLAGILEKILKDQGEPNAYIAGREASGAFVVGLRYGSGTLKHKVEGERPVYWTGPSLGFDVGGDATKVFTLVYNLYDSQDLYKRYPQVEGRAYFVGGFSATYLRRGDIVLIPVRLGVGVRLGANIGYMKFSESSRWVPF
jgi:hypothetical protein